jgi:CBS domain-containing protein
MPAKSSEKSRRSPRKLKSLVEKSGALSPGDSVDTAATRMREMDTKQWPVAEGRTLVGMVEGTQPGVTIGSHGHDPKTWRVSEIMNRTAVFCYEDEDCASACRVMKEHDLAYLPVVDRQMRIVGIFSLKEVEKKASSSGSSP